jgi:hypothetical protein
MEHIQKLGDDKYYLKSTLWPMLQALFDANNVEDFCRQFPPNALISDNAVREQHEKLLASQINGCLQGVGTSGPWLHLHALLTR